MELTFWIGLLVIIYTYLGYPVLLFLIVSIKRKIVPSSKIFFQPDELPSITLLVACFNEAEILKDKIKNTLQLDYPLDKLKIYFVTDGSTDNSVDLIYRYPNIKLFHENERKGKNAAVNRVMKHVETPIIVFSDANTFLNKQALKMLVRHFKDTQVGAVAGEKRVIQTNSENAAGSGEGAYWKYESKLKTWDSELKTVVGAAGELFSIRTSLYEEVPTGVLIEDFRLSMKIAEKGLRVVYEPAAYAMEMSSFSIEEESKRKVRISAGGLIEVAHFIFLLNVFKYGWLSFQYVSHRMLRWTLAPLFLPLVLIASIYLGLKGSLFYGVIAALQIGFYVGALVGHILRNNKTNSGVLFVPYYFVFMNVSVYQGLWMLIQKKQTHVWAKAQRKAHII